MCRKQTWQKRLAKVSAPSMRIAATDVLVYAFDKSEIDAWRLISDVVTGHYV